MKRGFSLFFAAILLTSCQADIASNQYSTSSVGVASSASECSVVSVRQVNVKSNNGLGTVIGSVAGGVAGYSIGSGSTAHNLGAIGGAVLGGMIGDATQGSLSSQSGFEYIVKLSNGQIMTLTQGNDVLLTPGQRCMILFGNPARLIAY